MGALSFNYSVFPYPKTSTKFFEYRWRTSLIEYGLKYERYAALSDASIFNAPVAVTKVATGVCLYDLFVEKKEKNTAYFQNYQPFSLEHNSQNVSNNIFLYKRVEPILWHHEIVEKEIRNYYTNVFRHSMINRKHPNSPTISKIDVAFAHINNIRENYEYIIVPPHWKLDTNALKTETIPHGKKLTTSFLYRRIARPYPHTKISLSDFFNVNKKDSNPYTNMYLLYNVKRDEFKTVPYPNENAIEINGDSLTVFESTIISPPYNYKHTWRMDIKDDFFTSKEIYNTSMVSNLFMATPLRKFANITSEPYLATPYFKNMDIIFFGNQASQIRKGINSNFYCNNASISDMRMNIIDQDLHGSFNKRINYPYPFIGGKQDRYRFNRLENINILKKVFSQSIFKNFSVSIDTHRLNSFYYTYGSTNRYDGQFGIIFDPYNYSIWSREKILSYYHMFDLFAYVAYQGNIYISSIFSHQKDKILNARDVEFVRKDFSSMSLSYYKNISVSKSDKFISEFRGYHLIYSNKTICELSLADFSIRETKYIVTLDGNFLRSLSNDLDVIHDVWAKSHRKEVNEFTYDLSTQQKAKNIAQEKNHGVSLRKIQTGISTLRSEENFDKGRHSANVYQIFSSKNPGKYLAQIDRIPFFKANGKSLAHLPPLLTIKKDRNEAFAYLNVLSRNKKKKTSIFDYRVILIESNKKEIRIYNHILPIDKNKVNMIIWPNQSHVPFQKSRRSFSIYDTSESIGKVKHDFVIDDTGTFIYKERKPFNPDIDILWNAYKVRHSMVIPNWGTDIYKVRKDIFIDNAGSTIEKTRHSFLIMDNIEDIVKSTYPMAVINYLKYPNHEGLCGFILPVSKVRSQMVINSINEFAKKKYKDVMITESAFGSVIAKPAMLSFDMSIDKLPKNMFINYINEMLLKTNLKADIEEGTFGFKNPHNMQLQYDEPWGYLNRKQVAVRQGAWGNKSFKHLMVRKGSFAFRNKVQAEVFANEWLDKSPYLCYYSYDTWGIRKNSRAFIEPQDMASISPFKEVYIDDMLTGQVPERQVMLQFGSFADNSSSIRNAWYEEGLFSDRLIKSSAVFQQIEWIFKGSHKCDLAPNDFGNWAWVYETPDPFQYDKYGMDELLLPEKDTQYENFEDLVFDREHMRPRDAIKEISDTQWIARLPIRHPVGKYKDVGNIYDDSAIDWGNYFGIQSSVVHDMFLKYYRIWEKNMFKFSTMTMQQAGNLMLEYLWSWIPDYYPLSDIEQAYRVFRLIRWYTECAIINNSYYIISYEYANLAWPDAEHMGICHIPSDLQEYNPTDLTNNSNDTMYSDIRPGHLCLRNNPIYTRSNDIWVTFKIKNKRNTTISLSLYNQSGSVNIYMNDKLVDIVYAHGSQRLVYNVGYSGFVNEFKIEKKAADNLDNNFIIGHISIANQAFKDLKIDFDPTLRAGNKPLNEVAKKLIQFAQLHERKDIAYHEMLTKNLSISEVYKMMVKYWQLHHENKWKGKRLTIKQV